ncbi:hypothetical protein Ddc_03645 [Ditylenchus destructor]|nr:hypothetical protein Ddc_03645 [Ditylenchus destructor]
MSQAEAARKELVITRYVPFYECIVSIRFLCNLVICFFFFSHLLQLKRKFKDVQRNFNFDYLIRPLGTLDNIKNPKWEIGADMNIVLIVLLFVFPPIMLSLEFFTMVLFLSSCPKGSRKPSRRYRPMALGQPIQLLPVITQVLVYNLNRQYRM